MSARSAAIGVYRKLTDKTVTFRRTIIAAMPDKLAAEQQVFTKTGGLHAAAVFDQAGEILFVRTGSATTTSNGRIQS